MKSPKGIWVAKNQRNGQGRNNSFWKWLKKGFMNRGLTKSYGKVHNNC